MLTRWGPLSTSSLIDLMPIGHLEGGKWRTRHPRHARVRASGPSNMECRGNLLIERRDCLYTEDRIVGVAGPHSVDKRWT